MAYGGESSRDRGVMGSDMIRRRRAALTQALRKARLQPIESKVMRLVGEERWHSLSAEEHSQWVERYLERKLAIQASLKKEVTDLRTRLDQWVHSGSVVSTPSGHLSTLWKGFDDVVAEIDRRGLRTAPEMTSPSAVTASAPNTAVEGAPTPTSGDLGDRAGKARNRRVFERNWSTESGPLGGSLPLEWSSDSDAYARNRAYGWVEKTWLGHMTRRGLRQKAERLHRQILSDLHGLYPNADPRVTFMKAVETARPYLEVKPIRLGGSTYRVPVEIPLERQYTLALRWLAENARGRVGKESSTFTRAAVSEIQGILKGNPTGTLQKRDELHKAAEANREFAHYRWN